eukprot:351851-Chlamydomonas_euryale.AAC.3
MATDIPGHTWTYLDIPGHVHTRNPEARNIAGKAILALEVPGSCLKWPWRSKQLHAVRKRACLQSSMQVAHAESVFRTGSCAGSSRHGCGAHSP